MPAQIHQNDIGIIFRITILDQSSIVADISAASTKDIKFLKPDGRLLTKLGSFVTNGTDGRIQCVSIANDLDICGIYRMEAYIIQSGNFFNTDVVNFKVHGNIP